MEIKGNEILPKKGGRRVLVYPACGWDRPWINFLDPDIFVGIDLEELEKDDFKYWGHNLKLKLHGEMDAINPPEIPKADEIVLLLKFFHIIGTDNCWRLSNFTEERWKEYQEKNLTCLRKYLRACEESALKKVFVIDIHGYEEIIVPQGYRKLFSHTPSVDCESVWNQCMKYRPCEKAEPLFSWDEIKKANLSMPSYGCAFRNRIIILPENIDYPTLPTLITYVKEK